MNTEDAYVLTRTYENEYATFTYNYLLFDEHGYLCAYNPASSDTLQFTYYYQ